MVCFDLGGVLVRHCRTWREGCAAAGLDVREGVDSERMTELRKGHSLRLMCGAMGAEEFYQRMAETTGGLYTPREIERLHHCWLGREYEGVTEVVRRLVGAGRVETGVLSNTNAQHWERLSSAAEYPSVSLLSRRHASHLLGLVKPMPEIYARFEELTGFRGPEILFLEDLPENQAAARARGWRVGAIDWARETAGQIEGVLEGAGVL